MLMVITKASAKKALGIESDVDFARYLRTTKQAVCRYGEDEPLPDGRQWQLRALRPDLFPVDHPKAA